MLIRNLFRIIRPSYIPLLLGLTISLLLFMTMSSAQHEPHKVAKIHMADATTFNPSGDTSTGNASKPHSEADVTPIAAVITINTDSKGNTFFQPK
jgi:hypothetical protein